MIHAELEHQSRDSQSSIQLRRAAVAALVDRSRELALPPPTATRILRIAQDPRASLQSIASVVSTDPVIAGRILSAANTAAYGGGRSPVTSIDKALGRLGLETLRGMVVQLSISGRVLRIAGLETIVKQLTRHAVFSAVAARQIARAIALDGEVAFSIGLLHDVGRIVGLEAYSRMDRAHRSNIALEPRGLRAVLDFTHEEIGADVAKKWSLPSIAVEAIGHHHKVPERLRSLQYPTVAHVAELVAHQLDPDPDCGEKVDLEQIPDAFEAGLSPRDLKRVLEVTFDGANELLGSFC